MHEDLHKLTLCDTAAKPTLEAATSLYELHVWTHVGLATVAADWTTLTMVYQVWRALKRDGIKGENYVYLTNNVDKITEAGQNV